MLKTRIIPSLLFKKHALVKSVQFQNHRNLGNPIQAVRVYNARNVDELIFLDICATNEHRIPLFATIEEISSECFMPLTIGGGISSVDQIRMLLKIGADKIAINTHAFLNPSLIQNAANIFGSQSIVVSIDVKKNKHNTYEVFIRGGTKATNTDPFTWVKHAVSSGAGEILLTSIDQDGMMNGFDVTLCRMIANHITVPIIIAGGAGKPNDFVEAVKKGKADAVSATSIFQYTQHTPNEVKHFMSQNNIPVRL